MFEYSAKRLSAVNVMGEGNLNITGPEASFNEYYSQHIVPLHNTYFKADISLVFLEKINQTYF